MGKLKENRIFVIQCKETHECIKKYKRDVYISSNGCLTLNLDEAALYETSIEAYRAAVSMKLDKDTIIKEIK